MRHSSQPYRYPTDCTEEEWAFVAPYLTLLPEGARQRRHDPRAVFDALRWLMRAGAPWRLLPGDFPPRHAVYDQARRWIQAGVFEAMVHDLRAILHLSQGRAPAPSGAVLDARTLQSTPESGARAGYDGAKRRRGSKGMRRWIRSATSWPHQSLSLAGNGRACRWIHDREQPHRRLWGLEGIWLRRSYLPLIASLMLPIAF